MISPQHIPLVNVTRGNIVESTHYGSLSIAFHQEQKLFTLGNDESPIFLRSSAKPFQALAFIERGGQAAFNLTSQEIAIMCASHSGTDNHVAVLEKLHQKLGLHEEMLQCGMHKPYDRETAKRMLINNEPLRPYRSDCSGKHTGMLAFATMIGANLDDYLNLQHPVQRYILDTFSEICDVRIGDIILGVDGCSAPVFAIPLPKAARGYANMCQPDSYNPERALACRVITSSMAAHPFMVAGPHVFDTDFMRVMNGKAISKIGAEGYLAAGVFPQVNPGKSGSIGISIKIADGDKAMRASSVVLMAVLDHLGVLQPSEKDALKDYYIRPVKNWLGEDIGEIRPSPQLVKFISGIKNGD